MQGRPIAVLGLGQVGLRLAVELARYYNVVGYDINEEHVQSILRRDDIPPDIDLDEISLFAKGESDEVGLHLTSNHKSLTGCGAYIICVPTPITEYDTPDLQCLCAAVSLACAYNTKTNSSLLIIESSVYPGVTRRVISPLIETLTSNSYYLAYSPERVNPGDRAWELTDIPKLISGMNPLSLQAILDVYTPIFASLHVTETPEIAEAAKLVENTYRLVNISLVNELKIALDRRGLDIWKVLDAAGTKPFGFERFNPSAGIGGHCIPVDPYYLREYIDRTPIIEAALTNMRNMPTYIVGGIVQELNMSGCDRREARILIVGVTYKPDIADIRGSPAVEIMRKLKEFKYDISFYDPQVSEIDGMLGVDELTPQLLKQIDIVVVCTAHLFIDWDIVGQAPIVIDTTGELDHSDCQAKFLRM